MTIILAQASFGRLSGLPADRVVNTFHFTKSDTQPMTAALDQIGPKLADFYRLPVAPASQSVGNFYSHFVTGPLRIRYYNMDLPSPRPLLREDSFTFGLFAAGETFPSEVALVLSFSSDPVAGVKPASRRGRIYLGPFRASAGDDINSDNRPTSELLTAVSSAAIRLAKFTITDVVSWVTYSGTRKALGQPDYFGIVSKGFIDDAWDTQRRRGTEATTRTTWTKPPSA